MHEYVDVKVKGSDPYFRKEYIRLKQILFIYSLNKKSQAEFYLLGPIFPKLWRDNF